MALLAFVLLPTGFPLTRAVAAEECACKAVARDDAKVGTSPGEAVTKEVPSSKESVSDMKKQDAREPVPPGGDVAVPSHRIPGGSAP